MKTKLCSIQDAFALQLQELLYIEKRIPAEFNTCRRHLNSTGLRSEIEKYIANSENIILKLERIFNHLMQEPVIRKNEVIDAMMDEMHRLLAHATAPHLKDILMISCIQNINAYKIASYKTAYMFAVELQLDTASDLLQQILGWELATRETLADLTVEEFNKASANANEQNLWSPH
jgi:ferritin-like metal-binding protein YciE